MASSIVTWYVLPNMAATATRSAVVIDTLAKFDASPMSSPLNATETFTFFNLTNAYELQTQVPAPKPIFREVAVQFNYQSQLYDYESQEDGNVMSYKAWQLYTPVNPADLDLAFRLVT